MACVSECISSSCTGTLAASCTCVRLMQSSRCGWGEGSAMSSSGLVEVWIHCRSELVSFIACVLQ
jgi:hypothetical protein